MRNDEDRALMDRVAAGEASARRDLVRRILPRAQRLCQSLLRNSAEAKDASQSGIVEVLRCAGTFRGESSLEHWADRVVARTALRFASSERRARTVSLSGHDSDGVNFDSSHQLLARECLDRLSEAQRTALVLRCGFEYSIEEIAELTGVSSNTVKDRVLRARRTLRQLIHHDASRGSVTRETGDEPSISAAPEP